MPLPLILMVFKMLDGTWFVDGIGEKVLTLKPHWRVKVWIADININLLPLIVNLK